MKHANHVLHFILWMIYKKMIQFQEYKHIFQKIFVMQIEKGVNIWYHDDVAPD